MKVAERYARLAQSFLDQGVRGTRRDKSDLNFRRASSLFYMAAINSDLEEAGALIQRAINAREHGCLNPDSLNGAMVLLKLERDSAEVEKLKEELFPDLQNIFEYLGKTLTMAEGIRMHDGREKAESFLESIALKIGTPMYVPLLTTLVRWREEDALSLEAAGKRDEAISLIDSAIKYARRIESGNLARELEERWLKR